MWYSEYMEVEMEKDYTYIYNQLVALYSRTKSLDLQKKCYDKIWYLVDKTMRYTYYGYVTKHKIFREDNEDRLQDCILRLMTRIKKWHDVHQKPYVVQSLKTVEFNEVRFILQNAKQQFYDNMESYENYMEGMLNDEIKNLSDEEETN